MASVARILFYAFSFYATMGSAAAPETAARSRELTIAELQGLKKKECAFVHVWATWCLPCLKELPPLLEWLGRNKNVVPVVIDLSAEFTQRQFSVRWVEESLRPPFVTYRRPASIAETAPYLKAIDKDWNGALPYSALFHRGKRKLFWPAPAELDRMAADVRSVCP